MFAGLIGSEFRNIIYNACEKKAAELGVSVSMVQVCFRLRYTMADYEKKLEELKEAGMVKEFNALCEKLGGLGFLKVSPDDLPIVTYHFSQDYRWIDEVSIMKILGCRIDFKGYSLAVPPFILKSLVNLADANGISRNEVFVFATPYKKNDKKNISLYLYDGNRPLKPITLANLLDGEPDVEQDEPATEAATSESTFAVDTNSPEPNSTGGIMV